MLQDPAVRVGIEHVHRDPTRLSAVERLIGAAKHPGAIFEDPDDLNVALWVALYKGFEECHEPLRAVLYPGGVLGVAVPGVFLHSLTRFAFGDPFEIETFYVFQPLAHCQLSLCWRAGWHARPNWLTYPNTR